MTAAKTKSTPTQEKVEVVVPLPVVKFKKLHSHAEIPTTQTASAAGMDLHAVTDVTLVPMVPTLVSTGLAMELPHGIEAQVRPRSGLALQGITVFNSPGTIDADYRGEIKVILINVTDGPYVVSAGMRMAQMVFQTVTSLDVKIVKELSTTDRGSGGFGSTGK